MTRIEAWLFALVGAFGMGAGIALDRPIEFGIGLALLVFGGRRLWVKG